MPIEELPNVDVDATYRQIRWLLSPYGRRPARPRGLAAYGRLCGWTLARAHARTGDRIAVAAYLGKSERFERALAELAEAYADQTERHHAALGDAVATGRVSALRGI